MFGVDSFSHKVYRIVDLWLILVFFFKKSDIDRIFGVTLVSAKTRAVPTGESKFRAKTDVATHFLVAAVMSKHRSLLLLFIVFINF